MPFPVMNVIGVVNTTSSRVVMRVVLRLFMPDLDEQRRGGGLYLYFATSSSTAHKS